jgi:hypothetical protein
MNETQNIQDSQFAEDAAFRMWLEGIDTCAELADDEIALALLQEPVLRYTAQRLTELCGKPVARADLDRRIQASSRLQNVRHTVEWAHERAMVARCQAAIAEKERTRAQRQERNCGARCGARTRSGRPCMRKVVLGKKRCPNHGGLSTGPRTPEGRARSLANLHRTRG